MSMKRLKGKFRLSSSSSVTSHLDNLEDWSKYDERVLECIYKNDVQKLQQTIQKKGVSPVKLSVDGETALHIAVKKSSMTCVDIMLQVNPELSTIDMQGRTVYHLASLNGDTIMLKKLLDYSKLNLDVKDINEMTALHYAVASGEAACVKLLIDYNCSLDLKEVEGRTPLLLALLEKYEKIAMTLIENGAKVNNADNLGRSALVVACSLGMCQVVTLLLAKGADKNISDTDGRSLETIATEADHIEVVDILRSEGDQNNATESNEDIVFVDGKKQPLQNGYHKEVNNSNSIDETEKQHKRSSTSGSLSSKRSSMVKIDENSFTSAIIESLKGLDAGSDAVSESSVPEHELHMNERLAEERNLLAEQIHKKDSRIQELEAQVTSATNKYKLEMDARHNAEEEVKALMLQIEALMENAAQNCPEIVIEEESSNEAENNSEDDSAEADNYEENVEDDIDEGDEEDIKVGEQKQPKQVEFADNDEEEEDVTEGVEREDGGNDSDESVSKSGYRKKSLGTAKQHIEMLEERILSLEEDLNDKDNEISELETKLYNTQELVDLNNNTTVSMETFNEIKAEKKTERNKFKDEIRELETKIKDFDNKLSTMTEENSKLQSTVEEDKEEKQKSNEISITLQNEITNLKNSLQVKEREYDETIECYRKNVLAAYQNELDSRLTEVLSRIVKLRAS